MPRLKNVDSALLNQWVDAKKSRDFGTSDRIRDELRRKGINTEDVAPPSAPRLDTVNRPYVPQQKTGPSTFDDWRCPECSFINFPHRRECKVCTEEYQPGKFHSEDYEEGLQDIETHGRPNGFGEILWALPDLKAAEKRRRRRGSSDSMDKSDQDKREPAIPEYGANGQRLSNREMARIRIKMEREAKERAEAKSRRPQTGEERRKEGPRWANSGPRKRSRSASPIPRGNRRRSHSPAEAGPERVRRMNMEASRKPPEYTRMALAPALHEYKGVKKNPFA
eukprot:Hpha_TRINITY_DN21116_c0_g1::TRINITY_DN21116_c0_g1_i1::g.25201::m.25201